MTASCARCGSCCDPVIVAADIPGQCGERARSEDFPHANDLFITQHWHPLGARIDEDGATWLEMRCDMFDPDSRACTAHDSRPPVCRDFPWYGEEPSPERIWGYPDCSYVADLPPDRRPPESRPLIPLTVIPAREAA